MTPEFNTSFLEILQAVRRTPAFGWLNTDTPFFYDYQEASDTQPAHVMLANMRHTRGQVLPERGGMTAIVFGRYDRGIWWVTLVSFETGDGHLDYETALKLYAEHGVIFDMDDGEFFPRE